MKQISLGMIVTILSLSHASLFLAGQEHILDQYQSEDQEQLCPIRAFTQQIENGELSDDTQNSQQQHVLHNMRKSRTCNAAENRLKVEKLSIGTVAKIKLKSRRRRNLNPLAERKNGDPNLQDELGQTALMSAAWGGNANSIASLLATNADPNLQDERGQTALMLASLTGKRKCVRLLLDAHADIDAKNELGQTALMLAVQGHNDLINRNSTPKESPKNIKGRRKERRACQPSGKYHVFTVTALLEGKASPDVVDNNHQSALAYAQSCKSPDEYQNKIITLLDAHMNPEKATPEKIVDVDAIWQELIWV